RWFQSLDQCRAKLWGTYNVQWLSHVELPSLRAIEHSPTGGNDQLRISVRRFRFALWKARRIEVGDPGLEPGWVTPHAPQTCASTSSASRPAVSRLILPVVRHRQQSRDGGPVAGGRCDAEGLRREPFPEWRAADAVWVP